MIDRGDFVPRAAKLLDVARDSGSFVPSRSWSSQCAGCHSLWWFLLGKVLLPSRST